MRRSSSLRKEVRESTDGFLKATENVSQAVVDSMYKTTEGLINCVGCTRG